MKWLSRQFNRLLRWLQRLFKPNRRLHPHIPSSQSHIQQTSQGACNLIIGQMSGGTAIESIEAQTVHFGATIYQSNQKANENQEASKQVFQEKYDDPLQGLNALVTLMQLPEVRRSVTTFSVVFEAACQQINVIANYKALHDLLHTLELDCYDGIIQESKRLLEKSTVPVSLIDDSLGSKKLLKGAKRIEDSTVLYNLIRHDITLQNLLVGIQKIAALETISVQEIRWLANLKEAQMELHTAIEERELHRLPQSIKILKRVLAIQPSRINTNLVAAARSLRLPNLVNTMQLIIEKFVDVPLKKEKLQHFQQGFKSLEALNSRLEALIAGHDNWQVFDLELRRIEDNLSQDINELKASWPDLLERTMELANPSTDQWIVIFQQDIQDLDIAIQGEDEIIIRQCFHVFRRRAKESFYQIDVALKDLCEELREVGGALVLVLRIIE